MAPAKKKRLPLELRMLSPVLPSKSDRDVETAKKRKLRDVTPQSVDANASQENIIARASARTPNPNARRTVTTNFRVDRTVFPSLQDESDSDEEEEEVERPPHQLNSFARDSFPILLDESDSDDDDYYEEEDTDYSDEMDSDVEDDVDVEDDSDKENNNNNNNNNKFVCPPIPEGNGKHSFKAIQPVNFLLPSDLIMGTFSNLMICPAIDCPSKLEGSDNYHPLETTYNQYGFATELYITCSACGWGTAICPLKSDTKGDTPNSTPNNTPQKKKKNSERESEQFHKYLINYNGHFLMQKLGVELRGLDLVFALLGIAPNHGSKVKWNRIANRVGLSEALIAEEVMEENRAEELKATLAKADEYMEQWLNSHDEMDADEDEADRVRSDYLYISKDGKYGITISCDGAWQKRKIGMNGGDSHTGHNFALGGYTNKIVGLQCYSKHCRLCESAEKKGKVVKVHRCPRNYGMSESAKKMEPTGAVQHCVDIHNSKHNIYVATLVTDDDATTRSNVKHSYHDIIEQKHPGSKGPDGLIPSNKKRKLGWPTTSDNKLKPPNPGILPIWVEEAKRFFADPQHRCRCVGKAFYKCESKSGSNKKGDDGLLGAECERAKRAFGFYLKKNVQCYSLEDFCKYAPCVFYHQFNMHHLCNIEWCTTLQNQQPFNKDGPINCDDDPTHGFDDDHCHCDIKYCKYVQNQQPYQDKKGKAPHKIRYKYRNTKTEEEKKLYHKVYDMVMWLLLPERMEELWHPFNTQKNETMQRKAIALCPKDIFLGGRTTLHDRLRLIVVLDSLGEFEGMSRIYHSIGLPPLSRTMGLWAAMKDKEDKRKREYKKRPDIKRKRAAKKVAAMKERVKADRRAEKQGITYKSGIANEKDSSK